MLGRPQESPNDNSISSQANGNDMHDVINEYPALTEYVAESLIPLIQQVQQKAAIRTTAAMQIVEQADLEDEEKNRILDLAEEMNQYLMGFELSFIKHATTQQLILKAHLQLTKHELDENIQKIKAEIQNLTTKIDNNKLKLKRQRKRLQKNSATALAESQKKASQFLEKTKQKAKVRLELVKSEVATKSEKVVDTYKKAICKLENEKSSLDEKVNSLEKKLQAAEAGRAAKQLDARVLSLTNDNADLRKQLAALKTKHKAKQDEFKAQYEAQSTELEATIKMNQSLQSKLAKIDDLKVELDSAAWRIRNLLDQLDANRLSHREDTNKITSLKTDNDRLARELRAAKQDVTDAQLALESSQQELAAVKSNKRKVTFLDDRAPKSQPSILSSYTSPKKSISLSSTTAPGTKLFQKPTSKPITPNSTNTSLSIQFK
jgi:chromosome segregation ATPase